MGSLTSRPKTQIVQPATTSVDVPVAPTPATPAPEELAKARAENILRRSRSVLGTVLTGFRGVLTDKNISPQRKNLLGE